MPNVPTQSNALYELLNLRLNAVALCGEGANSRANIIFTKMRRETENMTYDEILAGLTAESATVVKSHVDTLLAGKDTEIGVLKTSVSGKDTEIGTLKTSISEKDAEIGKLKTSPAGTDPDEILKSVDPAVAAYVSKLRGTVDTLLATQAEQLATERFAKCKAIPVEETSLKEVLKSASPAVLTILEAAAAAIEKKMTSTGTQADGTVGAAGSYAKLEKSAKAIATERKMTFEKAFTIACTEDPDTYAKYTKGE